MPNARLYLDIEVTIPTLAPGELFAYGRQLGSEPVTCGVCRKLVPDGSLLSGRIVHVHTSGEPPYLAAICPGCAQAAGYESERLKRKFAASNKLGVPDGR